VTGTRDTKARSSGGTRSRVSLETQLVRVLIVALLGLGVLLALFAWETPFRTVLRALFPLERDVLYPQEPLVSLALRHLQLVFASSVLTMLIAVPIGVFVTRPVGQEFLPLTERLAALGQTFPPVAVLSLTYPALGFGFAPSLVALTIYGLLPVLAGTVAGLRAVPSDALEAARGMGMTPAQTLARVELPMAARVILGGIRTSVVVNVGTAAIGAAIGAGGLGLAIFAGLENQNFAYVLEGAAATALIAVWADLSLGSLERVLTRGS
jgi:osmoprotectant transport system permease protein